MTLLVGHHEEHSARKKLSDEVLVGYLSAVRCRLFAYGPDKATVSSNPTILCLI